MKNRHVFIGLLRPITITLLLLMSQNLMAQDSLLSSCLKVLKCGVDVSAEETISCETDLWNPSLEPLKQIYQESIQKCAYDNLKQFFDGSRFENKIQAQLRLLRTASYFKERESFRLAKEKEFELSKKAISWIKKQIDVKRKEPQDSSEILKNYKIMAEAIAWIDTSFFSLQLGSEISDLTPKILIILNKSASIESNEALYHYLYLLQRAASNAEFRSKQEKNTIDALEKTAIESSEIANRNNAIWAISAFYASGDIKSVMLEESSKSLKKLELLWREKKDKKNITSYIWVLKALARRSTCTPETAKDKNTICIDKIKKSISDRLFAKSKTAVFGGDKIVFLGQLSNEKFESLKKSTLDIRKSFFAFTGSRKHVVGDPNSTLKVYIYPSKQDYEIYHSFLTDLGTQNGGIYIEQRGSLYTFERSEKESRYSLDELYRHELTHYLVGRYLVPGMWGEHPLYQDNKMVWFDEGIAEFLVGANDKGEIENRSVLLDSISTEDPSQRLTIGEILESSYQKGFRFYPYAAQVFSFLAAQEEGKAYLSKLFSVVRNGSVTEMAKSVKEISQLAEDKEQFSKYLSEQVKENRAQSISAIGRQLLNIVGIVDEGDKS